MLAFWRRLVLLWLLRLLKYNIGAKKYMSHKGTDGCFITNGTLLCGVSTSTKQYITLPKQYITRTIEIQSMPFLSPHK